MLLGSEKQLAQAIATALCKDAEAIVPLTENWEKIANAILIHILQNAAVIGIAPPNGGPLQGGRLA